VNYPPGAANDPRAPWNQLDPDPPDFDFCPNCGEESLSVCCGAPAIEDTEFCAKCRDSSEFISGRLDWKQELDGKSIVWFAKCPHCEETIVAD
jgi:hypothetical protein